MATDTLGITYKNDGATVIAATADEASNLRLFYSKAVATATTNQPMRIALIKNNLKSIGMLADQDVTIVTNNSGSPVDTFNLKAGKAYVWTADFLVTTTRAQIPFSVDVTEMFISNASGFTANVVVAILVDGSV